ncbi:MAG: uroporphyrinogen decarboxylase family protein [Clostridiaceae bacterium]
MNYSDKYLALMGMRPKKVPHWEHWSNPDAESYLTGIDYYEHPRLCRIKMAVIYPQLELPIPDTDEPKLRPKLGTGGMSSDTDRHTVRWGDGETETWQHGEAFFKSEEEVFSFSPLQNPDFSSWPHVVENMDFSTEETIYRRLRKSYPQEWGIKAPEGDAAKAVFYNTMFMWPLLTFGWELFLQCCLDERFERIMDEFAEINRRVFRAIARLPVNFVLCHDDIVTTRGPVCSPNWMHKYVFPRYEEFWSILKNAGKEVIFMADGCMDAFADDVMACGARGIISEPYTDYKKIARKHKDCFLAGEGDNRVLSGNDRNEIKKMVLEMADTARMTGGYMMCIGNHIPWNVPPEAVKYYLDYSADFTRRA